MGIEEKALRRILGRNVRIARTSRGWSQETLGELAGMDRTYVGAVERAEASVGGFFWLRRRSLKRQGDR